MHALDESYAFCERIARRRARNFYYSFLLLPRDQRRAMCALYAFMRYCDDLSDEPGAARDSIERWRVALDDALQGRYGPHPAWPAFHHAVMRYQIPHEYFHQMIEGVASDFGPRRFATFEELHRYCYRVASVVGLAIIHIFGFRSPEAMPLAEKCGVAFQLTNILRDVREDACRDRIYLPAEDLAQFAVSEQEILEGVHSERLLHLLRFETARARRYYQDSMPLLDLIEPRSRKSLWALITIYSRLLERIESSKFDVFSQRIKLPALEKSWIVLRALMR
jgi:phytoene synthase